MAEQGIKRKLAAILRENVEGNSLLIVIPYFFFVSLIFFWCILFPSGCSNDGQGSPPAGTSDTASASLAIRWHDTQYSQYVTPTQEALDCEAKGVEHVVCNVYDTASGTLLATGGPWSCTDHSGIVENIPAGEDRTFVVLAEDAKSNVLYQGETVGITVNAGSNIENVVVNAYLFVPTLVLPDNDEIVDPNAFSLEWDPLVNALEYLVQVAKDTEFYDVVIDQTTPGTTYGVTTLEPSTEYFWQISGVDQYTNVGAESETRRIITSDCTYSISSTSNTISSDSGSGSFSVTASSSFCAWFAEASENWITFTSRTSDSGDGTISYSVSANTGAARSATITIAGRSHTINQDPGSCTHTISPTNRSVSNSGSTYNVTVTATHSACAWATSENYPWISLAPSTGSGSGTVRVTVSANSGAARSATITIAGRTHTINQDSAIGSLKVILYPSGAVSAGARWRVDGGDWNSSGYTQKGLSVGNHLLEFNTIPGWIKPTSQTVTINNNQTSDTSGEYSQHTVIDLSVYAYKIKKHKYASLTWSGANSRSVDVYRDGSIIATTRNDGAYVNGPIKASTSATYQLCEAGTSICSNMVTVSW